MSAAPPRLRCPRCGYDQSGVVETWCEACPLHSTCTECGLQIDLCQLHRDGLDPMRWWIERAPGFLRLALATVIAPFLALAPQWLFRRVRMTHEPRLRRLMLPLLALALLAYVALVALVAHRALNASFRAMPPGTPAGPSDFEVIVRSLWPFQVDASGAIRLERWWGEVWVDYHGFIESLFLMVLFVALSTIAFAALPIARRRAKVQWRHLIRAALILAWTPPFFVLSLGFLVLVAMFVARPIGTFVLLGVALGVCLWHANAWALIAGRHLRMSLPWAVALSVTIIGAIGTLIAYTILSTYQMSRF